MELHAKKREEESIRVKESLMNAEGAIISRVFDRIKCVIDERFEKHK